MNFSRKEYTSEAEKKKDFWIGFAGWFIGNIILCLLQFLGSTLVLGLVGAFDQGNTDLSGAAVNAISILLSVLPWLLNLGLLIFFAVTRTQIALGMLVAFAVSIALVILAGVVLTVACFVLAQGYQP